MHAVPASLKGQYVIRFTVTSPRTTAQVRLISLTLIKGLSHETKTGEWNSFTRVIYKKGLPIIRKYLTASLMLFSSNFEILWKCLLFQYDFWQHSKWFKIL
jgi:hypothetical protein